MRKTVCKIFSTALLTTVLVLPHSLYAHDWRRDDRSGYVAGDFHNHSTFTDGSTATRTLIDEAVGTFDLDWFAQSGHGGKYPRDGRYDNTDVHYWDQTVGATGIKGDDAGISSNHKNMWRWQSLQEFQFGECRQAFLDYRTPIWVGLEWEVPGHEHCTTGIIDEQFKRTHANANALAQFEYLFDMEDNDMSGGLQGWTGKIPNPPKSPTAEVPHPGIVGHAKAVAAAQWMETHYPYTSYMTPAHVERKGPWNQDSGGNSTGWNIEHFRDLNNAAPTVCFGAEFQPGHQADGNRGGFSPGTAFGGTYGGTGYYAATIGGMWDALLGEGRNFWFFASSDWHDKGEDGDQVSEATTNADFWPGEYQKDYVFVNNERDYTAQDILNGMRSGNSYVVQGDLIDGLEFTATRAAKTSWGWRLMEDGEKTMGETLKVQEGDLVVVTVKVRDPDGTNHCPYNFDNPSLAQSEIGISQPLNMPELHHVDLIGGDVTGKIDPSDLVDYTNPANPSTQIVKQTLKSQMVEGRDGWQSFSYVYIAEKGKDRYLRLRGTNLPPNTPNETDAAGNPLADTEAGNIACSADNCAGGNLDNDVEAWSDLWFYSNPIYVDVVGD
jgi:hypothetical protein